jgi:hypothetical protein
VNTQGVDAAGEIYGKEELQAPGELKDLIKEVLNSTAVLDPKISRTDIFRSQLNLINRSLLTIIESENYSEIESLATDYMEPINQNCQIERRDCETLLIYKQDHLSHKVLFELAGLSQSGKINITPHWTHYALMSFMTQVGDMSIELQEFFIIHSKELKSRLFAGDSYLQTVFLRALTVIAQTLSTENSDVISRLSGEFEPWLYRTDDRTELNRIRKILWPLWAETQEFSSSQIEPGFAADSGSFVQLAKAIPSYSYNYFQIQSLSQFDKCLYSLDQMYRGILEFSNLDTLWKSSNTEEKKQCLDKVESYLSQQLIIESLKSADNLLKILNEVKREASSSSFLQELQNRLRPTKDSIVALRESFSRVQTFSFRVLLPPSVTRYDQIEKRFLSLSKNLKMFIEYPAIMGALYHLKDIKQTSMNANFQLIQINAEKILTEFILGFGMPLFELGLDEGSYRYPTQLEFMHSFSFGLGTGFFERMEIDDGEIYKFIVNHYAINQLKYFEEQLQFFKDSNSSHKYYSLEPFCHAEYNAIVDGTDIESSDFLINLSNLDSYTYTETNNGLLVFDPYQQRFNEYLGYLRVDAANYITFRRFLRNHLTQVSEVKGRVLKTDSELGVNEQIYRIHREAINFVHDVTRKSFECYTAVQSIEVKRRLHIMWFEYLHFAEVHKAMTALADGSSYDDYKELDRLGLSPHLQEYTQNIFQDRYRLSLMELNLRYAHYLSKGSKLAAQQLGQDGQFPIKPRAKIEYNLNRYSENEKKKHQWVDYHPDVDVFIERAFNASFTKIQRTEDMVTWSFKLPNGSNLFYLMKTLFDLHLTADYFNNEEAFYRDTINKVSQMDLEELFEKVALLYSIYNIDNILPEHNSVPSEENLLKLAEMPQFFEDFRDNITRYQSNIESDSNFTNEILSYFVRGDGFARHPYDLVFDGFMGENDDNPLWIALLNLEDAPQIKNREGLSAAQGFYRSVVQMDGLFIPLNKSFEDDMSSFYKRLSHDRLERVQKAYCHGRSKTISDHSFQSGSRSEFRISLLDDIHMLPSEDIDPEQLKELRGWSAEFYRISKGFLVTEDAIERYLIDEIQEYPVCR